MERDEKKLEEIFRRCKAVEKEYREMGKDELIDLLIYIELVKDAHKELPDMQEVGLETSNKNTFPYKSNIIHNKKREITPTPGSVFMFCEDEDDALDQFRESLVNNIAPEVFLTDFFKTTGVKGILCEPVYIGGKKYGFFGRRSSTFKDKGVFYLYEMD